MRVQTQKPQWLRKKIRHTHVYDRVENLSEKHGIHTVCHEAACPNRSECFSCGTCTFIVLGDICTRNCGFCNVQSGRPEAVDYSEPQRVAAMVSEMGLNYAVITMVTRDDLEDGGALICAEVVNEIRKETPETRVELLISDMQGDAAALQKIADSAPDVIAHNIEMVKESYSYASRNGDYWQSLTVLDYIKRKYPHILTKSGIMLGLGESRKQISDALHDLRLAGCDILTVGQYCQPSSRHVPVQEYIEPAVFEDIKEEALSCGFLSVASGPFVRSSYRAAEVFMDHSEASVS